MAERSNRLRIVGGKDYKSDAEKATTGPSQESIIQVTDGELIRLYEERTLNRPANLEGQVIKTLFDKAAEELRGYNKGQLYALLLDNNLWQRPSFTLALLEEVQQRLHSGSFEPRK